MQNVLPTFYSIYLTFPNGMVRIGWEVLDEKQGKQETVHLWQANIDFKISLFAWYFWELKKETGVT